MKIIAFDPGYERLGVAVLEKKLTAEKILMSSCLLTKSQDPHVQRIGRIYAEAKKIIQKFSPQTMILEKIFFAKNQKTALLVAEARGALLALAEERNLTVFEYTPLEVKLAITGSGVAPKNQVALMVKKLIKLPEKKEKMLDDEFDAIAIGLTHFARAKMDQIFSK